MLDIDSRDCPALGLVILHCYQALYLRQVERKYRGGHQSATWSGWSKLELNILQQLKAKAVVSQFPFFEREI